MFFRKVLEVSKLFVDAPHGTTKTVTVNIELPNSALWSDIPEPKKQTPGVSNIEEKNDKKKVETDVVAYTNIALRATYGQDAVGPDEVPKGQLPKFGENFCQFIIQSDPDALYFDETENLKPNGHIKQWPSIPASDREHNYTPIFYVRKDNRDAVDLNATWISEIFAHIETLANKEDANNLEKHKLELLNDAKEKNGGNIKIKLRGVRFLIYPYDKKSSNDKHISLDVTQESKRNNPTLDLIKELFSFGRSAAALPQQEVDDQSSLTAKFVSDSLAPLDLPPTVKSTFSKHVDKARDEVMAWLDNHDDFLKLAKDRDTHAIKEKLLPLFKARQKRIDNLTLKEPKSGAPARPNDPVLKQARMPDEPIKSLLKIIDDRITKRISTPKTTTSQLPADTQIALISTTLVAIANMPEEPEE
jgi:hypothetical protein